MEQNWHDENYYLVLIECLIKSEGEEGKEDCTVVPQFLSETW